MSASLTASCTNCLIAGSPHGPSARLPNPPAEPFHAGDADAAHFGRFAVEHRDAGVGEDVSHFILMTGFVVVVAEHGDRRHVERGDLAREDPRFVGQTGIGEVAGEQQHVRRCRDLAEQRLKCTVRGTRAVQIADSGDANQTRTWSSTDRRGP